MDNTEKRISVLEVVNLFGSIASITGISLLWIRESLKLNIDSLAIISTLITVLFIFGSLSLVIAIIHYLYFNYVKEFNILWKITFFTLGLPLIMFICVGFFFSISRAIAMNVESTLTNVPIQELRQKYGINPENK